MHCEPAGGCNADSDCTMGKWCDEATNTCTAKLANGMPIPTDGTHTNPTLNGKCTATAATLVCSSGVCDTVDNACGIADGDPGCTAGTATECRSGACSLLGTCEPSGGCNEDADCPNGQWCEEEQPQAPTSVHMCRPKLVNGNPIPNDPGHTNPTLAGSCTAAAATLVCQSGLCNATLNTCVQCTSTNTSACTGSTLLCGPTGSCVSEIDSGVADAGGDSGVITILDAGGDAGEKADASADAGDASADSGANADSGAGADSGANADSGAGRGLRRGCRGGRG